MVGGQTIDVESEGCAVDLQVIEWIHRRKTGALFEAAAGLGSLFGGGSGEQVAAARAYGMNLGLAFQIADDVLDETASTEALGKRSKADRGLNKATYPAVIGIEGSIKLAAEASKRALESLSVFQNAAARTFEHCKINRRIF